MPKTMRDPSRDEMLAFLASLPYATETDEIDREAAVYWFASDWHGGQYTNLYSALSTSPCRPPLIASGPEPDGMGAMLYAGLESHYGYAGLIKEQAHALRSHYRLRQRCVHPRDRA